MKIAIIGTAGRNDDRFKLVATRDMFQQMVATASGVIQLLDFDQPITLVSGGAAWADHVAVELFFMKNGYDLQLCLPCPWDPDRGQFHDTGVHDFRSNPGGTANYYHRAFSMHCQRQSLMEIDSAIRDGAEVLVGKGMHDRNKLVAQCDALIAMTFGDKNKVKDGGTADTVRHYLDRQMSLGQSGLGYHIDLHDLSVHGGIRT